MRVLNEKIFDLNPKKEARIYEMGEGRHKALIIDDYFQNPRDVAQLFDELIYTKSDDIRDGSPAFRSYGSSIPHKKLAKELFTIHFEHYKRKEIHHQPWGFDQFLDRYDEYTQDDWDRVVPHVDNWNNLRPPHYALVIYMNEKNIHGGTQFVRRVDTPTPMETLESVDDEPLIKKSTKINPSKPLWWHESEWQQYCLIPMKFNRLISYRSNLCHAPYTNGRFYHKNPRKIISGVF